ncbi:MAG: bifunctional DNA-formamidopyrimidine glycosylase/DNA-(apurinic or apyrimidinic site) lyase [Candidatus Dasytiphilus stammeri]
MPELPEVENICHSMRLSLLGTTIINSEVRNGNLRFPVSKEIYTINYQKILGIQRRARYIIIKLSEGYLIIHLGMSGSLRILPSGRIPTKHDHIDLVINNKKVIRYTDPRRFGYWIWSDDPYKCSKLQKLGPEPLSKEFSSSYLFIKSRHKHVAVKPWLMDNQFVVGIGNIYANESLFRAGINPTRRALTLTLCETNRLVSAIKTVLQCAIICGGTTLRNFTNPEGLIGNFYQKIQVYGRTGKSCNKCGTLIEHIKYRQRSTFFCIKCQK